jgi:hypothetical protein
MRATTLVTLPSVLSTLLYGLATPAMCYGQEYLPLDLANTWEYEGSLEGHERKTVVGTIDIWGMSARVIEYTESTHNTGLQNYWTIESDRDILLWGFYRAVEGFGWLYNPAIRTLDAPLFVGKTWSSTVQIYSLPDTVLVGTFTFSFEVYEEGTISVPAGNFQAFGIGTRPPLPAHGYSLSGAATRSESGGSPDDWYSEGVGPVRYITDQRYDLLSFDQTTPVLPATWGSIKGQFR